MTQRRKIILSFTIPVSIGVLFLLSLVSTCERFPELTLEVTTDSIATLAERRTSFNGTIKSFGRYPVTQHGFCWGEMNSPTLKDSYVTSLGNKDSKGSFFSVTTDFSADIKYFVRAYATTSSRTVYGNELSFTSPEANIPIVSTTAISNITQDSAQSGGNITDDGGASITARGVCWSTSSMPTINDSKTNNGTGTGNYISSITGLTCNTKYFVRAYATNTDGTGYGDTVSFATSDCPAGLPTVTTTKVTNITSNSTQSGGDITNDGGSPVLVRGVCWSTSSNPTTSDSLTTDGSGTGNFLSSITGLTPNTMYYVRAYATNDLGIAYGEEKTFTTQMIRRSVLEYFTNASGDSIYAADSTVKRFATDHAGMVYDLHYHMDYPEVDPMNQNNPLPASTRDFYYSVSVIPFAVLNGGVTSEYRFDLSPTGELDEELLLTASLEPPLFELFLTVDYKENRLEGNVTVICLNESFDSNLQLYIVVIEKEVTAYPGLNQGNPFRNVVLDMLPSPGGKLLGDNWEPGSMVEEGFQWDYAIYVEDVEDLCVVAFLQSRDNDWILQADAVPFQ